MFGHYFKELNTEWGREEGTLQSKKAEKSLNLVFYEFKQGGPGKRSMWLLIISVTSLQNSNEKQGTDMQQD